MFGLSRCVTVRAGSRLSRLCEGAVKISAGKNANAPSCAVYARRGVESVWGCEPPPTLPHSLTKHAACSFVEKGTTTRCVRSFAGVHISMYRKEKREARVGGWVGGCNL